MRRIFNNFEAMLYSVLSLIMISPFIYMLVTSLQETFSPFLISLDLKNYSLNNYIKLINMSGFHKWVLNSFFISISGALLTLIVCSLGAYAFVVKRYKHKNLILIILMGSLTIPFEATVVPLWLMMGKMNLIDSYLPLILPIPNVLGLLLIRNAILELPKEVFESAKLDGCSDFKIFTSIVLPVIKPILITVGILYFTRSWNSFLWPLIISNTDSTKTLTVGLAALQGNVDVNYGITMAGSMLSFLPPFIIYITMQKSYISGLSGSVKN